MSNYSYWFERDGVDIEAIINAYKNGLSCYAINKRFNLGVDNKTVYRFLKASGVQMRGRYDRPPKLCPGCDKEFELKDNGWNRKLCYQCAPSDEGFWTTRFYKYGITKPQFDKLWEEQSGLCGICEDALDYEGKVCVDHCHKQGHFRGLLCNKCNIGLHYIESDKYLAAAIRYIEKHRR